MAQQLRSPLDLSSPKRRLHSVLSPFKIVAERLATKMKRLQYQRLQTEFERVRERQEQVKFKKEIIDELMIGKGDSDILDYVAPKERALAAFYLLGKRLVVAGLGALVLAPAFTQPGLARGVFLGGLSIIGAFIVLGSFHDLKYNSEELVKVVNSYIYEQIDVIGEEIAGIERKLRELKS